MLTIRNEQMEVFSRDCTERYKRRLAKVLFERHPAKFASTGLQGSDNFVEANIELADKYGVDSELYVAVLLDFVLVHGPRFASKPEYAWAVEILEEPDLDGDTKVARLDGLWTAMQAAETSQTKGKGA